MNKKQVALLLSVILSLLYFLINITNIGTRNIPTTYIKPNEDGLSIKINLANKQQVKEVLVYFGYGEGKIEIQAQESGQSVLHQTIEATFFQCKPITINREIDSVILTTHGTNFEIREIGMRRTYNDYINISNSNLELITNKKFSGNINFLIDEQNKIKDGTNYRKSSYFDEIYHARTAYELYYGLPPFDLVHPPLGKWMIALGIGFFGGNPFGWRFMNLLFGSLIFILIALLSCLLVKNNENTFNRYMALVVVVLMATDFLHTSLSRTANLDTFSLFYVLLTVIFAVMYLNKFFLREEKGKNNNIFFYLSFISGGLAFACKWNALYTITPILVLLIIYNLFFNTTRKEKPNLKRVAKVFGTSLVSFLLPYYITYLPILIKYPYYRLPWALIGDFVMLQNHIFKYHSTLHATHPFSSEWYQWPLSIKPIWIYCDFSLPENLRSTIAYLGNPLMWGLGLLSILILLMFTIIKPKENKESIIILLCYFMSIIPWLFIGRIKFIYHYYLAVPWLYLSMGLILEKIKINIRLKNVLIISLLCVSVLMFVLYYPVLTGVTVSTKYIEILKLMKNWIF